MATAERSKTAERGQSPDDRGVRGHVRWRLTKVEGWLYEVDRSGVFPGTHSGSELDIATLAGESVRLDSVSHSNTTGWTA